MGRTWLEQHSTTARRWLMPRAMAARQRGATAASSARYEDAESGYLEAIALYGRASYWPPFALGRMWPLRALVWHDLAGLHAQQGEHAKAVRVSEREVTPILRVLSRVRPRAWLWAYAQTVVDVAEWAYKANDPLMSTHVTRAKDAAKQTCVQVTAGKIPPAEPGETQRLVLRAHTLDVFALEDQRTEAREAGDEERLAAADHPYAVAIATVADLQGDIAEATDAVSDWAVAAEFAGIAYRQHHRIDDAATTAKYLRAAIHSGERYVLTAPTPQDRTVERLADWHLAATERDPDIAGDHAAVTAHLHRAAELYGQLPRTYQTAAQAAGVYAFACEEHDRKSTQLHAASKRERSSEQAATLRKESGNEFVAAARYGRYAIDLYSEAHRLVERDTTVGDADQQRRGWLKLELQLCDRLPEICHDLVLLGIPGANDRLGELYERCVSVANLAWRLLPDRRATTAPTIAKLLRDRARHLIENADHDPTAYGRALDYAMDSDRVEQAYPPASGIRRSQLLTITYGLIAASELGDEPSIKVLLKRWGTTYEAMMRAGRRLDAAEVQDYLHHRIPELSDRLSDPIPGTPPS